MRLFAALSLLANRDERGFRPYAGAILYLTLAMGATFAIGAGVYFGGIADDLWIAYPFLAVWSAIFFAYLFSSRVRAQERTRFEEFVAPEASELVERDTTLRVLMDNLPGALVPFAADRPETPINFISEEIEELAGVSREDLVGAPAAQLLSLVHPEDRDRVAEAHASAVENVAAFQIEFRLIRSDGEVRWVSERAQATVDHSGVVRTVDGVLVDATDRREAQERIVIAEERYRKLVEEIPLVVYLNQVLDDGERLLYVGPHITPVTGYSTWEWIAPNGLWATIVHEDDRERVATARRRHREHGEPFAEEYRITRKDGTPAWVQDEALVERDDVGRIVASRGYLVDVTERKRLEEQLSHQAVHDTLTGLANRVLLKDRVIHALERRERHGRAIAVLFIDIDDFKTVNDSRGHHAGDALLVQAAARLREVVRPGDTPACLGGDEFAVLLEDCTGAAEANEVTNRIAETLSEPFDIDGKEVVVGASVGIAIEDGRGATADELLRDADVAMYRAKSAGKGRAETYQPSMRAEAVLRFERTSELRRACDQGEFSLRYQPIVSLQTGATKGLEALVRWEHPRWQEIGPGDFIPLAEETGLIVPLGEWVLESVCRASQTWAVGKDGRRVDWLSANVSLRELQETDYTKRVARILEKCGVDPGTILLEVTESAVMTNLDGMIEKLNELRAMGVRVAVDDFGTGYSSLEYLDRLPIDMVKVASPFIEGLGRRRSDDELARAILHLGDTVGIETVAEGVQRAEQRDQLLELGCQLGQGFFFAEPLAEDAVLTLLGTSRLRAA